MTVKIPHSFKKTTFPALLTLAISPKILLAQTPPSIDAIGEPCTCGAIEISPPSAHTLNFGTVNLGKPSSKTVTLKNTGRGPMILQEITVSGDSFTKSSGVSEECSPSQELPIGQTCKIEITFAPSTTGNKEGSLKVTSQAANSPYLVDLKGKAQGTTVDCLDDNVTLESATSGPWEQASTWNLNKVPDPSDLVKINPHHTVEGGNNSVKAQCIIIAQGGTLIGSKPRLKVETGEIFNRGKILGKEGQDGVCHGNSVSAYQHAKAGGDVFLDIMRLTNDGLIQGGRGGHDITHGNNCPLGEYIEARGGDGGAVNIYASSTITNNGTIGSEKDNAYQGGGIISSDGNGGVGSNNANAFFSCSGSSETIAQALGSGYNNGRAQGGNGGKTVVSAAIRLVNMGTISSGYGGDGRALNCEQGYTGKVGNVVVTAPTLDNKGTISAGKTGDTFVEPDIMLSGPNMRIDKSKNITIFGGEDWRLSLSNLSEDALSASESITLAVGKGGSIDLRGNAARILSAGKKVEIFADNILLDEGVRVQDLAAASNIQLHPSKILYAVNLSAPGTVTGSVGSTLPIELVVLNNGPVEDAYTLTVTDSSGWSLGSLPGEVTLESLQKADLSFNVTLPGLLGATNLIQIKATSKNDPNATSIAEINAVVEKEDSSSPQPPPVVSVPITSAPAPIMISSPPCPVTGMINIQCDNHGQVIKDATFGARAIVSGGELAGTIENKGFISQITIQPDTILIGGILSGYIINQGTLADFEFLGASITGGMLSGIITNASKVGGTLIDVTLAPNAHLIGGKLQGEIKGDPSAPALLENVRVLTGSHLSDVKLGENVILEKGVELPKK